MGIVTDENTFLQYENNRLQQKYTNATNAVQSQERLSQLNDSYRKRYAKYIEIFTTLIVAFLFYLGISALQKAVPAIPEMAIDGLTLLIILYVAYYLFYAIMELMSRSEMNYDELDLPPLADHTTVSSNDQNNLVKSGQLGLLAALTASGECIGQECCPGGYTYDTTTNKCVLTASATATSSNVRQGTAFTTLEQAYATHSIVIPPPLNQPIQAAQDYTRLSFSSFT